VKEKQELQHTASSNDEWRPWISCYPIRSCYRSTETQFSVPILFWGCRRIRRYLGACGSPRGGSRVAGVGAGQSAAIGKSPRRPKTVERKSLHFFSWWNTVFLVYSE
jgi:hypothetical protein